MNVQFVLKEVFCSVSLLFHFRTLKSFDQLCFPVYVLRRLLIFQVINGVAVFVMIFFFFFLWKQFWGIEFFA